MDVQAEFDRLKAKIRECVISGTILFEEDDMKNTAFTEGSEYSLYDAVLWESECDDRTKSYYVHVLMKYQVPAPEYVSPYTYNEMVRLIGEDDAERWATTRIQTLVDES